ncbi:uncharacterized protein [Amphiura filiformis]|uniref:uncharacterized protein isoform X2 n=1 Tax=Amphiura filiformis TaxID=82378 RepID=UPI003B21F433
MANKKMDLTGLVERKLGENHRQDDSQDSTHGGDYKNIDTSTTSRIPNKHSAQNQSRKRRQIFSFIFNVYTATILFAVLITFTCAFLIVRIQELEVFLHHQDGYIRDLRNQFEAGLPEGPPLGDVGNRIASALTSQNRGSASRHLLGTQDTNCACPPGEKGDQGPRGERGRQGPPGREGDMGLRGVPGRHGRDGTEGPVGPRGGKGQKGDTGARGLLGRRGRKGDQGDRGFNGPPGPQGIPGELVGVELTELLSHRIKAIHLQGVPTNNITGITMLGSDGILKYWRTSSCTDTNTFVKDWDGNIRVMEKGQYLIYSRVLFYDSGAFYGANTNINGEVFLRCAGARASAAIKFGPCQSIGVAELNPEDRVGITSMYPWKEVEMSHESTYFGIVKLN